MTTYTANQPTFNAIQWTGSNLSAIKSFLSLIDFDATYSINVVGTNNLIITVPNDDLETVPFFLSSLGGPASTHFISIEINQWILSYATLPVDELAKFTYFIADDDSGAPAGFTAV